MKHQTILSLKPRLYIQFLCAISRNYCVGVTHKNVCGWNVLRSKCNNFCKVAEKLKSLNILTLFLSANFADIPCSQGCNFFRAISMQQLLKIGFQSRMRNCPCSRSLTCNQLVVCLEYITFCSYFQLESTDCVSPLGHVISTHCSRDLVLHIKHLHCAIVSLQCDPRLNVQHLQRDLCLEKQHLMMLYICNANLLGPVYMMPI